MTAFSDLPDDLPPNTVPVGTKGRILESALRAFAESGFAGASIRAVADGAGINSATLYSHFPSKERILAELVSIGSRELLERIERALEGAGSPTSRLDAIVGATVLAHCRYALLAIVTNREFAWLAPEVGSPAVAPSQKAARLLRAILADGVATGEFAIADSEVAAHVIEGMAQQVPTWFRPAVDDPARLRDEYVRLARRIVGAPDPRPAGAA